MFYLFAILIALTSAEWEVDVLYTGRIDAAIQVTSCAWSSGNIAIAYEIMDLRNILTMTLNYMLYKPNQGILVDEYISSWHPIPRPPADTTNFVPTVLVHGNEVYLAGRAACLPVELFPECANDPLSNADHFWVVDRDTGVVISEEAVEHNTSMAHQGVISIDNRGTEIIACYRIGIANPVQDVACNWRINGVWNENPMLITDAPLNQNRPMIKLDSQGHIMIVYADIKDDGTRLIHVWKGNENGEIYDVIVSQETSGCDHPDIFLSSQDEIYVAYHCGEKNKLGDVMAATCSENCEDRENWVEHLVFEATEEIKAGFVNIALTKQRYPFVVYQKAIDSIPSIYCSTLQSDGTWEEVLVDPTPYSCRKDFGRRSLTVSPDGDAYIVYLALGARGYNEMHLAHYTHI